MAGPSSPTVDEAIRVVVTPSQASYYAGEPFSVTITFTNMRTPESPLTAPRSSSHTHRRGVHSISSVPLSRPPTSPGTPRTPVPVLTPRINGETRSSLRKGHIGHGLPSTSSEEPPSSEVLRKRFLASRSLSVLLSPSDLPQINGAAEPTSPAQSRCTIPPEYDSGTSYSRVIAPLARTPGVPPNHPHARKHSLVDAQLQLQDLRLSPSLPPGSPSPHASVSNFSLSLDPIFEAAGSTSPGPPSTPCISSPIPNPSISNIRTQIPIGPPNLNGENSNGHIYPPLQGRPPRRPSQLGLGPPPSTSSAAYLKPPRTAISSTFTVANTELVLYAYAQLLGTLTITPLLDTPFSLDQTRNLDRLRSRLLKQKAVGGGSMDITSSLSAHATTAKSTTGRKGSHGRSSSLSAGILSIIAPGPTISSNQRSFVPGHRARTSSVFSLLSDGQAPSSGVGLGLGATVPEEIDPEAPLPTLDVQPTMLAVDLSLGPGQSRTYTYSLMLPENLPPTFRGRALKFSYQFILGICRAGSNAPGANPSSNSRVMNVPIRVYNHVTVGRPLAPYNLLWPVTSQRSHISPARVKEDPKEPAQNNSSRSTPMTNLGTYEDLQVYARNLLASFPDPEAAGVGVKLPVEALPPSRFGGELEDEVGNEMGCRQAVEVLTRNPRKASYDVNKDGNKVAVLTFPKSAYRLGETILGVVELNERPHRARVLKLSAMLEAHESLPGNIASPTLSRHMRRVHAEHHSCFMPATLRTTFSLDIPPDATPAFQAAFDEQPTGIAKTDATCGGLEWKVRICLLVAIASPNAREGPEGVRTRHLVRDGPRGQWGSAWKAVPTIAPLERPALVSSPSGPNDELALSATSTALSWVSYFASSLLGSNVRYHDGDEGLEDGDGEGKDEVGPEDAWRDLKVEMVECEVPVKVWPGNTAFKATEIVFDV